MYLNSLKKKNHINSSIVKYTYFVVMSDIYRYWSRDGMGGDRLMEEEILVRDKKGLQRALASINQLTREREELHVP